jgi:hypothetical protein
MSELTWLHLSDWHQKGADFDRKVVRDALIGDIRDRAARIDHGLARVDFVCFSGDLAFSGQPDEYQAAREYLFDPVLKALDLDPGRLFIVPGNHDLSRDHIYEMLPPELQRPLDSDELVQKWLGDDGRRKRMLEPFDAFRSFVAGYTGHADADYASVLRLTLGNTQVALLGLNSALMCARHKDEKGGIDDARRLIVGELQIYDRLAEIKDADIKIAVMHHPFDWLSEFDRNRIEDRLRRACHFVLHGHEHRPKVQVTFGTGGDCVVIPAGASYDRRIAENPRYTNAYNLVRLNLANGTGRIYLRRWSEPRNAWIPDTDTHEGGTFDLPALPKGLGAKSPAPATAKATPPPPSPDLALARERLVLQGYLEALERNNADLEPGGIKQTKVRVVLRLDEIYVGLQADLDRPDVDRRVMQDELDEIKARLEREEDPAERERQYQIWAIQARTLEQALSVSGAREGLSDIVQRHRQLVVLGDPGSGKTTLVRYLTLRLARAILAEPARLFTPQTPWDAAGAWRLPDLGAVRLPILLRIAHYAEARQKEPDLALVDYLPRYFAGLQVPYADELGPLLRRFLESGRCMVLLDGLDEIIDPADRRNIATAIGQFAGVFRESGLLDWPVGPTRVGSLTAIEHEDEPKAAAAVISWLQSVSADVRIDWKSLVKELRLGTNFRSRLSEHIRSRAREFFSEARYAHVGNRFLVTSRIAGYHFAGVPGDFQHYTIRRMSLDDMRRFLERWCPAVERRMADAPDDLQVEQRARREIDGILKAIETTPGVRRMAENPLLLRILAIIHRNEAHLPQRRVELYETATVTLLRDWHLERGTKGAVIDEERAMRLLGPLAFHIHEHRASGFLSKGETEDFLSGILARERGEDPGRVSLETRATVRDFLEKVRQHSGLFVERGEGLYGFMHLTFEEYFTARHLVSSSLRARDEILQRLHQPRWREPILLAVGSLSKQYYEDTQGLLEAILAAGSPYESVLHRDLLFAATCVGDSVNVTVGLRKTIAARLLALYCDPRGTGRCSLLRGQIKEALLALRNDQGDVAVEDALAEALAHCREPAALGSALDAVGWLNAHTPAVVSALADCPDPGLYPQAQALLRQVQARLPANGNGAGPAPAGWDAMTGDSDLARLVGTLWRYGWREAVEQGLEVEERAINACTVEADPDLGRVIEGLYALAALLENGAADASSPPDIQKELYRLGNELQELEFWALGRFGRTLLNEISERIFEFDPITGETGKHIREVLDRMGFSRLPEAATSPEGLPERLSRWGGVILRHAGRGGTMARLFAAQSQRLGPLQPPPEEEALGARIQPIQADLAQALLEALGHSADLHRYLDAAHFLVRAGDDSVRNSAAAILCNDLDGTDSARRILALQALNDAGIRRPTALDEPRRTLLLGLLDAPADQATPALDILVALGLTPELLAGCWEILRRPAHPLADLARRHLDGVRKIKGERPLLDLLDQGVRDPTLRPIALELLRKVAWQGTDTYRQALIWLADDDTELRHLAALLLAGQDDLWSVPRRLLADHAAQAAKDANGDWSALGEDAPLMRMLGGLWLQGWDDALTRLLVSEPAQSFVDRKHPGEFWGSFRTYPESEDCIRWLLKEAKFGQRLIPLFREAAARLVELERGDSQGEPRTEDIGAVKGQIERQANALLAQSATPPLERLEAAILVASSHGEASIESIGTALAQADEGAWVAALARLADRRDLAPWLRSLLAPTSDLPPAGWLRRTLAQHGLPPAAPPHTLAGLLTAEEADTRVAAALALLVTDLPARLLPVLVDAAQSLDDRVRMNGVQGLDRMSGRLATDGSTEAVETLVGLLQDGLRLGDRRLVTLSYGAAYQIEHNQPFWIRRWLGALEQGDEPARSVAMYGLRTIFSVSAVVRDLLCDRLVDLGQPLDARRAIARTFTDVMRGTTDHRADPSIQSALTTGLKDPDPKVRQLAALALQWAVGQGAWPVARALLNAARSDRDTETRAAALTSAGRLLGNLRGLRNLDASKDALIGWIKEQTGERGRYDLNPTLDQLTGLSAFKEAQDAESLLAALAQLDTLGLPEQAARLLDSKGCESLLEEARKEWEDRRFWLHVLPDLPASIAELEAQLGDPEPTIRRAAACALARAYHGDDDRPALLGDVLPNDSDLLRAMLDAAIVSDAWDDQGYQGWAVRQIAGWIEARPADGRAGLIAGMLDKLSDLIEQMGAQEAAAVEVSPYSPRFEQLTLVAALAELAERLSYRAFTSGRDLEDLVTLFARAALDPVSFVTRGFAIRALGNLQQLTAQVADILFAAGQDDAFVYQEAQTAVTRFKTFGPGSLERLTAAIRSPSQTQAYHAALLLGELGVNRSEELGREGRGRVAGELVQILDDPASERIVYDFSKHSGGERVGPLYDEIFAALTRVVSGPDAPGRTGTDEDAVLP